VHIVMKKANAEGGGNAFHTGVLPLLQLYKYGKSLPSYER